MGEIKKEDIFENRLRSPLFTELLVAEDVYVVGDGRKRLVDADDDRSVDKERLWK